MVEEQRLRINDLIQQTRSANAAEATVSLTFDQSRITLVGSIFGFITMIVAIAAALYARQAATEAKRSSDIAYQALLNSERPYLRLDILQCRFHPAHQATERLSDLWQCQFFNFGNFPAKVTRIEIREAYLPTGEHPEPVDVKVTGGRRFPDGLIIGEKSTFPFQRFDALSFNQGNSDCVSSGNMNVWLYGFIRYVGMSGTCYISGFCLGFDHLRGEVYLSGGDDHNFCREEKCGDVPPPGKLLGGKVPLTL